VKWRRGPLVAAMAAGGIGALIYALLPRPIPVDFAEVVRGHFVQTVDDDSSTRVRERYTVSAPLAGTLLRVPVRAGDTVAAGSLLASIVPNPSPLLEPRTRRELEQRLDAAEARKLRATAATARAQAALDQIRADLQRTQVLASKGFAPRSKLDREEIAARIAQR